MDDRTDIIDVDGMSTRPNAIGIQERGNPPRSALQMPCVGKVMTNVHLCDSLFDEMEKPGVSRSLVVVFILSEFLIHLPHNRDLSIRSRWNRVGGGEEGGGVSMVLCRESERVNDDDLGIH